MVKEVVKNNIAVNITDLRISMVDGRINLEKQGYKGSWAVLSTRQLDHEDVEDAVTKKWIKLTDKVPEFVKEFKANLKITKPAVIGFDSIEEARGQVPDAIIEPKKRNPKVKKDKTASPQG